MSSFLLKVITVPLGLMLCAWLFPNIEYTSINQPIIVGLVAAIIGVAMEYLLLRKGTLWISTFLDFLATFLVVYFVSNMFDRAEVSILGAVVASLFISAVEYLTHLWLIRSGRTRKSPA